MKPNIFGSTVIINHSFIAFILNRKYVLGYCMQAENMIAHKDEIFSRPKRTWFVTEKEKQLAAKAAKVSFINPMFSPLYKR